ncbi:class I SAM-dependent methyltransferase [Nocardioides terrigena]|uniref:class I SAM-dependent methyltransferase n=1 Tax=Nocardioides terrigena TaxID=424797 RepID=UPI000D31DF65|nr:class I SAM-dependent methyltransferase [Nocardioides terrigena]
MPDSPSHASPTSTSSDDYSAHYYAAHLGSEEDYSWDTASWREFFLRAATRIVALRAPSTVLDVGCAKGLLVQALVERGVDARGFDISEFAIAGAHPDVRDRVFVGTATDPIAGRFDLVTCIEVLEHMSSDEAQRAIDHMCSVTDAILLSSSPSDFGEPTHVNVQQPATWAAWMAERGFYRRTDADLSFLTPWAVLFERASVTTRDLVHRYEAHIAPLIGASVEIRTALLEAHREISDLTERVRAGSPDPQLRQELSETQEQLSEANHHLLTMRDHVVGTEAQVGRLNRDLALALYRAKKFENRVKIVKARREEVRTRARRLNRRQGVLTKELEAARRRVEELEGELASHRSLARRVASRVKRMAR